MSGAYRPGDQVRARYERDWFHAEIVRLESDGTYLVRWVWSKGRVDHRPEIRGGPTAWIEPEDLRPMQGERGNYSGF